MSLMSVPGRRMRSPVPERHCPLCGHTQAEVFARERSFEVPLVYFCCGNCSFIFQDPTESQAANPEFYRETYRRIYQASTEPTAKDLYQQRARAGEQIAWLQSLGVRQVASALDIGASSGLLLQALQSAYGARVVGVEPGDAYRRLAQDSGLEMYASLEDLLAAKPQRFQLVTLMHVLEHLPDPVAALSQIRTELLDGQGWLLVEVPNFYAHDSYELAHLAVYTAHSLREMLKASGYEVIASREHGMPRSETLPLYLGALARPVKDFRKDYVVVKDSGMQRKRRLGMLRRKLVSRLMPKRSWLPLEGKLP